MNTQIEPQETAAGAPLPAGSEPVPLVPMLPETEARSKRKPAEPCGSAGNQGQAKRKRSLAVDQKKPDAKPETRIKSAPAVQPPSPKKKSRVRKVKPSGQTAAADEVQPAGEEASEDRLPAVSEGSPEQAAPLLAEGVIEERLSDREIQAECSMPAAQVPPLRNEPDWPAAETVDLVQRNPPRPSGPALPAAKRGLLTVTLRVRHSPLTVVFESLASLLAQAWSWTQQKLRSPGGKKRLRICESVSLGEKRFLAVIQVDGEQFLVGGSASSVSTLAHLEPSREFSEVFQRHCKQDLSPV